jgi:multiple antibiotic resistance protein
MDDFLKSVLLLFVLLNPFIMSVYLAELIKGVEIRTLSQHLIRASVISIIVFSFFAWVGEAAFENIFQVHFASFMIFGGITFLIIGIRLILGVGAPVEALRPQSGQIAGAIAMPFIVGPGTISASVLIGSRLPLQSAVLAIGVALLLAMGAILVLKITYDDVQKRSEKYISRYMEIAGRVTALFTGTFAIELIAKGVERWQLIQ